MLSRMLLYRSTYYYSTFTKKYTRSCICTLLYCMNTIFFDSEKSYQLSIWDFFLIHSYTFCVVYICSLSFVFLNKIIKTEGQTTFWTFYIVYKNEATDAQIWLTLNWLRTWLTEINCNRLPIWLSFGKPRFSSFGSLEKIAWRWSHTKWGI